MRVLPSVVLSSTRNPLFVRSHGSLAYTGHSLSRVTRSHGAQATGRPLAMHGPIKATWSVRGFLFYLQNLVNRYKL